MKTKGFKYGIFLFALVAAVILNSCKNKEPSVAKIFVRSASNELVVGAKVIIVGDVDSNPATNPYVDTLITNGSGFAEFNLQSHFDEGGKDYTVAYFDIIVKTDTQTAFGTIRTRVHTTAVETVFLP